MPAAPPAAPPTLLSHTGAPAATILPAAGRGAGTAAPSAAAPWRGPSGEVSTARSGAGCTAGARSARARARALRARLPPIKQAAARAQCACAVRCQRPCDDVMVGTYGSAERTLKKEIWHPTQRGTGGAGQQGVCSKPQREKALSDLQSFDRQTAQVHDGSGHSPSQSWYAPARRVTPPRSGGEVRRWPRWVRSWTQSRTPSSARDSKVAPEARSLRVDAQRPLEGVQERRRGRRHLSFLFFLSHADAQCAPGQPVTPRSGRRQLLPRRQPPRVRR